MYFPLHPCTHHLNLSYTRYMSTTCFLRTSIALRATSSALNSSWPESARAAADREENIEQKNKAGQEREKNSVKSPRQNMPGDISIRSFEPLCSLDHSCLSYMKTCGKRGNNIYQVSHTTLNMPNPFLVHVYVFLQRSSSGRRSQCYPFHHSQKHSPTQKLQVISLKRWYSSGKTYPTLLPVICP